MKALYDGLDALALLRLKASGVRLELHGSARFAPRKVAAQRGALLRVGESSLVEGMVSFERGVAEVHIGKRSFVNAHLVAAQRIDIGDDVLMAWGSTIVDHNSHSLAFSQRRDDVVRWGRGEKDWTHVPIRSVRIEDKAWIGFNAIVLKGVTIGEGAVVGAGAVVTRDVPAWTVVGGNPARPIRTLERHER